MADVAYQFQLKMIGDFIASFRLVATSGWNCIPPHLARPERLLTEKLMKFSHIDTTKYSRLLRRFPNNRKILILIAVAFFSLTCAAFGGYHIYVERAKNKATASLYLQDKLGMPFPYTDLVDEYGNAFDHDRLMKGRAIIVLLSTECDACFKEGKFLDKSIGKVDGIKFFGIVVFGSIKQAPDIREKFPFNLFYDKDSELRLSLGIKAVPTKLFLEDGIIRKVWVGVTNSSQSENEFIKYLSNTLRP